MAWKPLKTIDLRGLRKSATYPYAKQANMRRTSLLEDHRFRVIECNSLLDDNIFTLLEYHPPEDDPDRLLPKQPSPYAAVSHVWRRHLKPDHSLLVKPRNDRGELSWIVPLSDGFQLRVSLDVLKTLARAALHSGAELLWLDVLCVSQELAYDREFQRKFTHKIFGEVCSCIVVCGGIDEIRGLKEGLQGHLENAWTLPEVVCPDPRAVLVLHHTHGTFSRWKFDESITNRVVNALNRCRTKPDAWNGIVEVAKAASGIEGRYVLSSLVAALLVLLKALHTSTKKKGEKVDRSAKPDTPQKLRASEGVSIHRARAATLLTAMLAPPDPSLRYAAREQAIFQSAFMRNCAEPYAFPSILRGALPLVECSDDSLPELFSRLRRLAPTPEESSTSAAWASRLADVLKDLAMMDTSGDPYGRFRCFWLGLITAIPPVDADTPTFPARPGEDAELARIWSFNVEAVARLSQSGKSLWLEMRGFRIEEVHSARSDSGSAAHGQLRSTDDRLWQSMPVSKHGGRPNPRKGGVAYFIGYVGTWEPLQMDTYADVIGTQGRRRSPRDHPEFTHFPLPVRAVVVREGDMDGPKIESWFRLCIEWARYFKESGTELSFRFNI
ncbi:hypothetical protein C8Q77DRAFT_279358 [Trametes polyzona]|nr:hypothetical protein C8Q77DRAFT_279358 [Trametes polyzona]